MGLLKEATEAANYLANCQTVLPAGQFQAVKEQQLRALVTAASRTTLTAEEAADFLRGVKLQSVWMAEELSELASCLGVGAATAAAASAAAASAAASSAAASSATASSAAKWSAPADSQAAALEQGELAAEDSQETLVLGEHLHSEPEDAEPSTGAPNLSENAVPSTDAPKSSATASAARKKPGTQAAKKKPAAAVRKPANDKEKIAKVFFTSGTQQCYVQASFVQSPKKLLVAESEKQCKDFRNVGEKLYKRAQQRCGSCSFAKLKEELLLYRSKLLGD